MGRNRNDLGSAAEAKLKALAKGGGTAESVTKSLRAAGVRGVSVRTVGRRLRELRGKVRAGRLSNKPAAEIAPASSPASEPALPSSPDEIPEGQSLEVLQRQRDRADKEAEKALKKKDLVTFAAMGRLITGLSEAIRKATPAEKPDPNDSPDMKKLGEAAAKRLHEYIDRVIIK